MSKLLGDMTEDTLKRIGGDKVANFYERVTGRPCNCAARKQVLNNLHRAAQRAVDRVKIRPPVQQPKVEQYQPPTKPVDEQ